MPNRIALSLLTVLLLSALFGCAAKKPANTTVATPAIVTLHGRILTIIDQPPMLLLAVAEHGRAEGRLLRHGPLSGDLYDGDMVTATVTADCWRQNTLGERGDFCLAQTLTKIDEPDSDTLEQPAPEEISAEEFRAALTGKLPNVAILDVRGRDELAKGVFRKAVLIPLDELAARHNELPKNKEIFVHCAAGGRAKMAAYELNRLGYRARFLPIAINSPECACPFDGR